MATTGADPPQARLDLDAADYHRSLAEVITTAGTTAFYAHLSRLLARLTGCTDNLVVRYLPFAVPTFLVNEAMDGDSVRLYLTSLYRLDPLRKLAKTTREPRVVSLRALAEGAPADERYMLELFKSALIFDELAVMLPAPGGVSIAVCCERRRVKFREQDRLTIERILPVIAALHRVHIDRAFALASAGGDHEVAGQPNAFMIVDHAGRVVHRSPLWGQRQWADDLEQRLLGLVGAHSQGQTPFDDEHLVHWEKLAADFPLAPGGTMVTVERQAAGMLQLTLDDSLATFRERWRLTDRETDIVRLILLGSPNSHIARALTISAGTVKNHRHRLYYKLDITSERELFSMFLAQFVHQSPGNDASNPI
ncbi:MAG: LuxR C-terminal-related transcriptional regulator [Geminicoccaceae bacterium]